MGTIATLEARYTANIIQFDKELKRMQTLNKRAADKVLNDHKVAVKDVNSAWSKVDIAGGLNRSLGSGLSNLKATLMASVVGITSGAGAAAAVGLAETFNRFTNSLKTAGLEGAQLASVQKELFTIGAQHGVQVESLGQMYGRVAQASKELGVSQNQMLQVTNAVAAAVRVSGQPISSASGAMLQMSQALGAGTVRAEEFNSMMEGMFPLVQAAANASEKYGGSVAKLRAAVNDGKLSSKEFFDLIVAGSASLEAQAAKAPLTVAQSYEVLKNKLVEAVGQTDQTLGVTQRLSDALKWLGENIDTVATALGVIAAAFAVALAPAVGKAALALSASAAALTGNTVAAVSAAPAMLAFSAAMNGTTTSAAALTTALRLLQTATGVGLAITAITAAVGYFAVQNYKASEATRQLYSRIEQKKAALDAAKAAADQARVGTGNLSQAEMDALTKTAALTGQVDLLTTAYGRLAVNAKKAQLEILALEWVKSDRDAKEAERAATQTEASVQRRVRGPTVSGDGRQPMPAGYEQTVQVVAAADPRVVEARKKADDAREVANADLKKFADARNQDATDFAPATVTTSAGDKSKGKTGGTSAEDRAKNDAEAIAQAQRQLRDATRAQADTAVERHAVALEALTDDRDTANAAVTARAKRGEISETARDQLIELNNQTYEAKVTTEVAKRQRELDEAALEMARLRNDNIVEAAKLDAEELDYKAQNADSLAERQAYERQALEARQRVDRLQFDAQQKEYELQLRKNELAEEEIQRMLAAREANFQRGQNNQTSNQAGDHKREQGPQSIDEWIEAMAKAEGAGESLKQKLFGVASEGFNTLASGISDAIMGAQSFAEAFQEMGKRVVASMVEMAVKFVMFEMLGRAFGIKGMGKAALGISTGTGGVTPEIGANYQGTGFWKGGLTAINELGPEVINLPRGSQVIPANVVKNAMAVKPRATGQMVQHFTTNVYADDAVMADNLRREAMTGNYMAAQHARTQTQQDLRESSRRSLRR